MYHRFALHCSFRLHRNVIYVCPYHLYWLSSEYFDPQKDTKGINFSILNHFSQETILLYQKKTLFLSVLSRDWLVVLLLTHSSDARDWFLHPRTNLADRVSLQFYSNVTDFCYLVYVLHLLKLV